MKKITVIGSLHEENNKTTIQSLFEIIEKVKPDVIFEEIPVDLFDDVYSDKRNDDGLEVMAVKKYLMNIKVDHYAVDIHNLPNITKIAEINKIENKVDDYIESINNKKLIKYKKLLVELEEKGFEYINTKKYINMISKISNLIDNIIYKDNCELFYANKYENDFHFILRENYMLHMMVKNISYYNNAVLLIGSMHLGSIIRKLNIQFPQFSIKLYNKN